MLDGIRFSAWLPSIGEIHPLSVTFSVALRAAYFAVSLLGLAMATEPRHSPLECYAQMTLIICADGWCSSTFALARSADEA